MPSIVAVWPRRSATPLASRAIASPIRISSPPAVGPELPPPQLARTKTSSRTGNPQMSQMNADAFLGMSELRVLICGHLRHLCIINIMIFSP
jgi:hypothetical protein